MRYLAVIFWIVPIALMLCILVAPIVVWVLEFAHVLVHPSDSDLLIVWTFVTIWVYARILRKTPNY